MRKAFVMMSIPALLLSSCFEGRASVKTDSSLSEPKEEISIDILNEKSTIFVGEQLSLDIEASDHKDHHYLYESMDDSIFTVDENGILKGIKAGYSTLYVTIESTDISTTMDFTVIDKREDNNQDEIVNPNPSKYTLSFHDEFDGNSLNEEYWSYQIGTGKEYGIDGWGNQEAQSYQKENIMVKDGRLLITAKKESKDGRDYTSGRIRTYQKVAFTYGRIDARIRLPSYPGLWPAFWMLPNTNKYGSWPNSGEIDIMEAKGRVPKETSSAVHMASLNNSHTYSTGKNSLDDSTSISEYHVYSFVWEKNDMRFLCDEIEYYRLRKNALRNYMGEDGQPFDTDFYLLLNLAVGGHFDNYLLPEDKTLPASMEVDYVRWWTLKQS